MLELPAGWQWGFFKRKENHMRERRPKEIILLEPKISGDVANEACKKLGKKQWIRSEADGFNGGLWVMWNAKEIELKLLEDDKYFLHFRVVSEGGTNWEFMSLYARSKPHVRRSIWERSEEIEVEGPCVLLGDFNFRPSCEQRNTGLGSLVVLLIGWRGTA